LFFAFFFLKKKMKKILKIDSCANSHLWVTKYYFWVSYEDMSYEDESLYSNVTILLLFFYYYYFFIFKYKGGGPLDVRFEC
jgi:hypothetical protein